jgi:hypothetical protein
MMSPLTSGCGVTVNLKRVCDESFQSVQFTFFLRDLLAFKIYMVQATRLYNLLCRT